MDVKLSSTVSNEDLVAVLRTILLFLESINFKATSTVLQNECFRKGYLQNESAPAKIVVVHSSTTQSGASHQRTQTEFPNEDDESYVLESSVHDVTETENKPNINSVHSYYKNCADYSAKSSNNSIFDNFSTRVMVSDNIYLEKTPCVCSNCPETAATDSKYDVEQLAEEPKECVCMGMNSNKQNKNLQCKCWPNTIESEVPSNAGSEVSNQWGKNLRKTCSNPALKTISKSATLDGEGEETQDERHSNTNLVESIDCQELRKRFRQLQNEHRKLMGVTTELTTALQTHILGQSENLNSMLNNCRNIYPDLFKSVGNQTCNHFQNILTKHSSPRDEDELSNALSNQTMQHYPSPKNSVHAEESSRHSATQTNVGQDSPPSSKNSVNTVQCFSRSNKCQFASSSSILPARSQSNKSQGSLPSRKTIRNSDNIIQSSSSLKKTQNEHTSQGSVPSRKTIENSDNIIQCSSSLKKTQNQHTSQGSVPSRNTIGNSDNIIQSSSSLKKPQNEHTSQGSVPSRKTIGNSDNIIQSSSSLKKTQNEHTSQGSVSSRKTIGYSDNIIQSSSSQGFLPSTKTIPNKDYQCSWTSPKKIQDNTSQGSLPSKKTIRNSDNILLQSSSPRECQDRHNIPQDSPPSTTIRNSVCICRPESSKSVKCEKTSEDNAAKVLIEIKGMACNSSHSTTIITPRLKRPYSSNVILVTTTETPRSILLRHVSCKSLDESLLDNNFGENQSCGFICTANEEVPVDDATQIPDLRNSPQQTSNLDNANQETPEIFVTTEHLGKLQQGCNKCKSSGESNYSSPRNMYFDLDFRKLKKDMLNGDVSLKLGLIQALRWRITQGDSETRDQVISSYIRHDLFGLHSAPNSCGQSTTEIYYCPNKTTPHPLQEGMARLVNTFASLTLGRDYLCQDDDLVISLLVPLVIGTHYSKVKIDEVTRDMLMATLQKLSIRNRQRMRMISAGLVEYLVSFLATEHATISEYCMEYTTALLMNLCLHHEARDLLHSSATDVVSLLADLLNTKHRSCMPYVNGAMFSLLGDPYINKEAQRLNLAKLIEYHIKQTDGEMRRQLEFILKLHRKGDGQNECGCDPNLEPENEVDLLEPELDAGDSINVQPAGEELLKGYRLVFSVQGTQVNSPHLKCLCRAVTPRTVHSSEKLMNVTDNSEDDKTTQVCQDNIIQETNFQEEEEEEDKEGVIPQTQEQQKCGPCLAEKSTMSEKPNVVDFSSCRSNTSQLRTCATTVDTIEEHSSRSNKSCMKTKRGDSPPESIQGCKRETKKPTQAATRSEKSSRSNSPDMSYSEETKQFYHTPSAKSGIFEPQKQKKLHRVPPSFTRTIPLPQKTDPTPSGCCNPFCSHPYSKSMPVTPKENSSARNPPYALDYPVNSSTCYREGYTNQTANVNTTDGHNTSCNSPNVNKPNRYRCNCYNVIKGYIDQVPQECINSGRNEDGSSDQRNTARSFVLPPKNVRCNCPNPNNVNTREAATQNINDTTIKRGNDVFVNFSYEELLKTVRPDHVCPNSGDDCQCYDVVFQSRPKVLRTPP